MLADPHDPDAQLREHRESCPDCNLFGERLLGFESRLERALRVTLPPEASLPTEVPPPIDNVVPLRAGSPPAARRRATLAMAASVLLAVVVAGGLWLSTPGPSLAADVVTHMREEPQAWRRTDVPVPDA